MADFIQKYEKELGINITFSIETEPLGTGACMENDGEPCRGHY
jgi:NDP-sugar pyrophosphorylase family protein